MEYLVLEESHKNSLMDSVNSFLKKGWKLYGNLVVNSEVWAKSDGEVDGYTHFYQAMIKEPDNK